MQHLENLFASNIKKALFDHDTKPHLAIAVSGGCDSTALLILAHHWAATNGAKLSVLTVDHGLREGSKLDCQFVQSLCMHLKVDFYVLNWIKEQNPTSAIQSKARQARYQLMTDLCKELDILYLCTAHHMGDSVENLFLRLSKSHGLFGTHIKPVWFLKNVMIIRPLLQAKKSDLMHYLQKEGIAWREDPSNANFLFARNKMRACLQSNESLFDIKNIFEFQRRISSLAPLIQQSFVELMASAVLITPLAYARVDLEVFRNCNLEVARITLSYLVTIIRGTAKAPRYKSIVDAYDFVLLKGASITLHGCRIVKCGKYLFIYRLFGKHLPQDQELNSELLWDSRFAFKFSKAELYVVSHLSSKEVRAIYPYCELAKLSVANSIGEEIIASLPAIKLKSNREFVFCPHLNYSANGDSSLFKEGVVEFSPSFLSSVAHLYCDFH